MTDVHLALLATGWASHANGSRWTRDTPRGPATLNMLGESGAWRIYELSTPALSPPKDAFPLELNFELPGPVKWVAAHGQAPALRVDVPIDQLDAGARAFWAGSTSHPWEEWATALTAVANGVDRLDVPTEPGAGSSEPQALLESLQESGFAGSVEEGQVFVHVNRGGVFRQVSVGSSASGGVISAELADWDALEESRLAAAKFALAANNRLPLARLAIDSGAQPRRLVAEVHFGPALIPGAWLTTALEAVEMAVALTAQELAALRDRELASLVLA
jgi:hypothetical protein